MSFFGSSFFGSLLDGGVPLGDGDADLSDEDDDDGAGEDGDDGAIADDEEEDEDGGVLDELEDDGGCGVDVDDVDDSRWQPAAPNASAMPSTSESLRFNIGRTSHLV